MSCTIIVNAYSTITYSVYLKICSQIHIYMYNNYNILVFLTLLFLLLFSQTCSPVSSPLKTQRNKKSKVQSSIQI